MMTIQDFKNIFGKYGIKFKRSVLDDYIITKEDIKSGNIVQKYIGGKSLANIANGFDVINDEICYLYSKVDKIEIIADDTFSPCGGEMELSVNAVYSIYIVNTSGDDTMYEGNKRSKVNAIVTTDNDDFEYVKPNIVNEKPNDGDKGISFNILASYYYKGVKYTASKNVIQPINKISSWLIESEQTNYIDLILNSNEIGNDGGIITATVKRYFSRIYYQKDSCGNKVAGKSETEHVEDITSECIIASPNKKACSISHNKIFVAKQEIGAKERKIEITARYFGFGASTILKQAEGGKITYTCDLLFDDKSHAKFIDLETSLKKTINVPLLAERNIYIDGEFIRHEINTDLIISSDSEWLEASLVDDDKISINVSAIEANKDKENDREGVITISDNYNEIRLIISQSLLDVVKEEIYCEFYGGGEYTSDELDNADLYFKTYKLIKYEDDSYETVEYNEKLLYDVSFDASGADGFIKLNGIIYKDDKYVVSLTNKTKNSISDIDVNIKLSFKDKSIKPKTGYFVVKGNTIIDDEYELCFEGHNKFKNLKWDNNKNKQTIKVNSLKHILINGKKTSEEYIPFRVGAIDENGKEYFDDSFSVKIDGDELIIFPYNVSSTVSKTYIITQLQTGLTIKLKLDYIKEEKHFNVPLKIIVYSKTVEYDLWTGEGGYLMVDGKTRIDLNPCWLSPTMIDNFDIAYNGTIDLVKGEHTFEAFKVLCINGVEKTHFEVKFKEKLNINEETKNIFLTLTA